jgi:restriction endonuclease S subunit
MNENKRLKDIAEIISGYSFRTSVSDLPSGDTFILQSRDINDNLILALDEVSKFDLGQINTKAFAKIKDVLLGSKGNPTIGYVENDEKILVSSSIYIIRVKANYLIPKYLAIYLNSSKGRRELNKITLGGYIKGISKKNLEELMIPIPSKDIQHKIVSLHDNIIKQKELIKRKSEINNQFLDYTIEDHLNF